MLAGFMNHMCALRAHGNLTQPTRLERTAGQQAAVVAKTVASVNPLSGRGLQLSLNIGAAEQ
jgi:hypothetical protein